MTDLQRVTLLGGPLDGTVVHVSDDAQWYEVKQWGVDLNAEAWDALAAGGDVPPQLVHRYERDWDRPRQFVFHSTTVPR